MKSLSKIGLILIIVGMTLLPVGAENESIVLPLCAFAVGGVFYLMFDSEDK